MLSISQIHPRDDAERVIGRPQGSKRRITRVEMDRWLLDRGVTLIGGDFDESGLSVPT
jgi:tRNA-splicing ligase RtcB (3'-phosphate/5'-hydroxy nucleic acid ligase)